MGFYLSKDRNENFTNKVLKIFIQIQWFIVFYVSHNIKLLLYVRNYRFKSYRTKSNYITVLQTYFLKDKKIVFCSKECEHIVLCIVNLTYCNVVESQNVFLLSHLVKNFSDSLKNKFKSPNLNILGFRKDVIHIMCNTTSVMLH